MSLKKNFGRQEFKSVRLELDAETHRLLRLISAHRDESMAVCAKTAVTLFTREQAKILGIDAREN